MRALAILHVGQGNASAALTYYQDMLTCMKTVSANETLEAMNSFLGSAQAMDPEALITVRLGNDANEWHFDFFLMQFRGVFVVVRHLT